MKQYLLGIDIGTSACKAAVFDEKGRVLASKSEAYAVYYPRHGWAEQNPEEWWAAVCKAVKSIFEESPVKASDIAGVGIDGQSWSAIPVDKNGRVLCNTPIWFDTRAGDICNKLKQSDFASRVFDVCGNPLEPSYTLPKILWYQKHAPDVYRDAYKILQSNSYIGYKLTDKMAQDVSQGYGLHCFDMYKGQWDYGLCREFGIREDLLPPIYKCHEIIGGVTEKASLETGLLQGTPVTAGGLDAACGTLGAGVILPGQTQEQGGQAGGMSICIGEYKTDKRLICSYHVVPDLWLLQGGTVGGGGIMAWMERELGGEERLLAQESGANSFQLMDKKASEIPAGSDGVIFLPYMAGERSPLWDPTAKGLFFGLDFKKSKGHMIRAALEGAAYSLLHNLEAAKESGAEADVLHAMGGAANSRLWTQIKADVTGKRIRVPSTDTATTLGAAILAGVGTGFYKSFEEAVGKTVTVTREHEPDMKNHEIYQQYYPIYLELYENLRNTMKKSDSIARRN